MLNLSIAVSRYITSGSLFVGKGSINEVYLLIFSNITWLFLTIVSAPYSVSRGWAVSRIIKSQLAFTFIHLLSVAALISFFRQEYPITRIAFIYLLFVFLLFGFRVGVLYLKKLFSAEDVWKNYILIGRNTLASDVRKYFLMNPEARYRFQGYMDWEGFSIEALQDFCVARKVHEIYCCVPKFQQQS